MNDYKMTPGERACDGGFRDCFLATDVGMFMVLPVLTTYGMALRGASEALIGPAIGIYGLAQAVFQIPFGLLSLTASAASRSLSVVELVLCSVASSPPSPTPSGNSLWPRPAGAPARLPPP